jgi:hypothetical protein
MFVVPCIVILRWRNKYLLTVASCWISST